MRNKSDVFWGSACLVAAVFVLINNMGFFGKVDIISLAYPIILVTILISGLMQKNYPCILFPMALLCIHYNKELGVENITPWPVLVAAFLGSIGCTLLFKKM